ncbi:MAG TPA: hypothetical protein PL182_13425 [Pseudobdellovibrionaceae bacterium]|nr:hypothetical protein [Pseudobdellovibrionaceae bacterium]
MEAAFFMVIGLMVLAVGAYFFLMIYYPEWVGITGSEAKKALDQHAEGSPAEESKDFF